MSRARAYIFSPFRALVWLLSVGIYINIYIIFCLTVQFNQLEDKMLNKETKLLTKSIHLSLFHRFNYVIHSYRFIFQKNYLIHKKKKKHFIAATVILSYD